jgi:hypothetical protein
VQRGGGGERRCYRVEGGHTGDGGEGGEGVGRGSRRGRGRGSGAWAGLQPHGWIIPHVKHFGDYFDAALAGWAAALPRLSQPECAPPASMTRSKCGPGGASDCGPGATPSESECWLPGQAAARFKLLVSAAGGGCARRPAA